MSAPAAGTYTFRPRHAFARYVLRLAAYDDNDVALGEPLEAAYVWAYGGLVISFR